MFEIKTEDTIVALATPPGIGAISVIRLSGPSAICSTDKIFSGKIQLSEVKSHTIHYGKILGNDQTIDDVLVSIFRKPNSYTGEDCVEISTHGSPFIVKQIISILLENNEVRAAEPGEFTKRAFLNGRIDLTQAEAVADIINSRTAISLRGARSQLNGMLSSKIEKIRSSLINISSFLELELDFFEENIELIKKQELIEKINKILCEIDSLLDSYSFGRVLRDGVNVVIVGEPNVGKSSLLNYLLKESRAIVSSVPGTTRDTIKEEVEIDGFLFKIIDTAGIRVTAEEIEKEGVKRSKLSVKNADLLLFVGDVNVGFSSIIEEELRELNPSAKLLKILNKIDLIQKFEHNADFEISLKSGVGLKELLDGLKKLAQNESSYSEKDVIINNIRHYNCLKVSKQHLLNALSAVVDDLSEEFVASDLRAANLALSEIIGAITSEEILNNIFLKFCIGK